MEIHCLCLLIVAGFGLMGLSLGLALKRRKSLKSEMRLLDFRVTASVCVVASILGSVYYEERKEDNWIRKAATNRGLSINEEDIGVPFSTFDKYYMRMEPYKETLENAYFDELTKALEQTMSKQETNESHKSSG